MNYKPILFSGEMVRAILDGRKNQTRRVTKDQNLVFTKDGITHLNPNMSPIKCPYGQVGDRLWVRETFAYLKPNSNESANPDHIHTIAYKATDKHLDGIKWKPSIHMPRSASRITLEITEIRIEKLQDISKEDAIAEGIKSAQLPGEETFNHRWKDYQAKFIKCGFSCPTDSFRTLWDSINAQKYTWESNPWVWVIKFRRIKP
jgi:hypothetical protein